MPPTILVVEEDDATRAGLIAALARAGYDVTPTRTFREAVREFERAVPSLLICGVRLGPYNGLHLLVRGRAEQADLNAIVIGPASPVLAREAQALGAAAYFTHPLDLEALLACVGQLVEGSADAEPNVRPASAESCCARM